MQFNVWFQEASPQRDLSLLSPILDARRGLLSIMPRIVACMATLWHAVSKASQEQGKQTRWRSDFLTVEHVRVSTVIHKGSVVRD